MGPNVVTTAGDDWRRQRKVTAPAFDGQVCVLYFIILLHSFINKLSYVDVWNTTTRLYHEMLNSKAWRSGDSHFFESFDEIPVRVKWFPILTFDTVFSEPCLFSVGFACYRRMWL